MSVVVVSPFVGQDVNTSRKTNVLKSLSDVTFLQNQAITRGTSLLSTPVQVAGLGMAAVGSKPRNTGYRSHLQRRDSAGKRTFQSYEWRGRRYEKPLNTRKPGPMGRAYGYETDYKTKSGVKGKQPGRVRSRSLRAAGFGIHGFGRALPYIGYGLVAVNIVTKGPKKAVEEEAAFGWQTSGLGVADRYVFDGAIARGGKRTAVAANITQTIAITKLVGGIL